MFKVLTVCVIITILVIVIMLSSNKRKNENMTDPFDSNSIYDSVSTDVLINEVNTTHTYTPTEIDKIFNEAYNNNRSDMTESEVQRIKFYISQGFDPFKEPVERYEERLFKRPETMVRKYTDEEVNEANLIKEVPRDKYRVESDLKNNVSYTDYSGDSYVTYDTSRSLIENSIDGADLGIYRGNKTSQIIGVHSNVYAPIKQRINSLREFSDVGYQMDVDEQFRNQTEHDYEDDKINKELENRMNQAYPSYM